MAFTPIPSDSPLVCWDTQGIEEGVTFDDEAAATVLSLSGTAVVTLVVTLSSITEPGFCQQARALLSGCARTNRQHVVLLSHIDLDVSSTDADLRGKNLQVVAVRQRQAVASALGVDLRDVVAVINYTKEQTRRFCYDVALFAALKKCTQAAPD